MRKATILLNIIRERGKRGLPVEAVCRTLYQPELYLPAYSKLYRNDGAMTQGVTTETVDGLSMEKIHNLIESLRYERFRWTPVRRTFIPKKNGQMRPLRFEMVGFIGTRICLTSQDHAVRKTHKNPA